VEFFKFLFPSIWNMVFLFWLAETIPVYFQKSGSIMAKNA
jgi:hypothetical protein